MEPSSNLPGQSGPSHDVPGPSFAFPPPDMQSAQAVAGPSIADIVASGPSRAPLKVTDPRSQVAKKKAYFIQLCTRITVQGQLRALCLDDETLTAEGVSYRYDCVGPHAQLAK